MSDGTIKWLSLITAILTSRTIFSIEEPENFLHPWMQAEIAQIMRDHISEKKAESFVLMTTHSESLLNSSQPEEIIIVDLKEGRTIAKRIENLQLIRDEISNSGFGLGHFYFSNSIQNV
jgi:predicted ATPase